MTHGHTEKINNKDADENSDNIKTSMQDDMENVSTEEELARAKVRLGLITQNAEYDYIV